MYLFHELPGSVRRAVAAEMARVLRPGGLVVLVDSVQARPAGPGGATYGTHRGVCRVSGAAHCV